jgi:hypothetical protein
MDGSPLFHAARKRGRAKKKAFVAPAIALGTPKAAGLELTQSNFMDKEMLLLVPRKPYTA